MNVTSHQPLHVQAAWERFVRAGEAEFTARMIASGLCWDHDHRQLAYPAQREVWAEEAACALGLWGHLIAESEEWRDRYLAGAAT